MSSKTAKVMVASRSTVNAERSFLDEKDMLNRLVHDDFRSYHAFKCELLKMTDEADSFYGREQFGAVYSIDPDTFFTEGKTWVEQPFSGWKLTNEEDDNLIFKSFRDRNVHVAIPFEYFDNPDAWEEAVLERFRNIQKMVEKAHEVMNSRWTYKASSWDRPELGQFFNLDSLDPHHIVDGPVYFVDYETGNVYDSDYDFLSSRKVKNHEAAEMIANGEFTKISCLR